MNKTAESLTAQFRDVAHAFNLEVWGEAMDAAGVDPNSELRAPDRVYYPLALRLAPTVSQLPTDPNSVTPSSAESKDPAPSPTSSKGKELTKGTPPPEAVVDVEAEEGVPEGIPLKKKKEKKEQKEQKEKNAKEKEPSA